MITFLIVGALALLFISAALAPLESLGWWAGWFGEKEPLAPGATPAAGADAPESPAGHFMVYLSGIAAITDDSIPGDEIRWIDALQQQLEGTALVRDVFPYSVTNAGLTGQRSFARMWRWLEGLRLKQKAEALVALVNIRNLFQVAVCADRRYGPIYNLGVAQEIVRALQAAGYRIGSGKPVTLLGYSGGAQISLGAAIFLRPMLKAPIRVVSVGGVMADDPGLSSVEHVYHLFGERDPIHKVGAIAYAGRWPIFPQSAWNQALAAGKITMTSLGPMTHNGKGSYYDWDAKTPDGRPFAEVTNEAIAGVLRQDGLLG